MKQILIYDKGKSYPKERYKEVTVHIPIPLNDVVIWGVSKEQHIYESNGHLDKYVANYIYIGLDEIHECLIIN